MGGFGPVQSLFVIAVLVLLAGTAVRGRRQHRRRAAAAAAAAAAGSTQAAGSPQPEWAERLLSREELNDDHWLRTDESESDADPEQRRS